MATRLSRGRGASRAPPPPTSVDARRPDRGARARRRERCRDEKEKARQDFSDARDFRQSRRTCRLVSRTRATRRTRTFARRCSTVARAVQPARTMKHPETRVLSPRLTADDPAVRRVARAPNPRARLSRISPNATVRRRVLNRADPASLRRRRGGARRKTRRTAREGNAASRAPDASARSDPRDPFPNSPSSPL
jgi:hypothetical protein